MDTHKKTPPVEDGVRKQLIDSVEDTSISSWRSLNFIPRLTDDEGEKYALTVEEAMIIEEYPTDLTSHFYTSVIEGKLPLERIRALDINCILARRALKKLALSGIEPEFIGIQTNLFLKAGDHQWELTL